MATTPDYSLYTANTPTIGSSSLSLGTSTSPTIGYAAGSITNLPGCYTIHRKGDTAPLPISKYPAPGSQPGVTIDGKEWVPWDKSLHVYEGFRGYIYHYNGTDVRAYFLDARNYQPGPHGFFFRSNSYGNFAVLAVTKSADFTVKIHPNTESPSTQNTDEESTMTTYTTHIVSCPDGDGKITAKSKVIGTHVVVAENKQAALTKASIAFAQNATQFAFTNKKANELGEFGADWTVIADC